MPVQVVLDEEEAALVIQAISMARLAGDFTAEEQLILKQVAEKLAGCKLSEDSNGAEKSD